MDQKITSIIGMSKNAGKTTLLNRLIKRYENKIDKLGIASIGIDGEKIDFLTGKPKPAINIPKGTFVVTSKLGLLEGTAEWKIHEIIKLFGSNEEVYLAEATESGTVKLIGTHTIDSIASAIKAFKNYDVNQVFIDGAYDRFSNANPILTNEIYLVIGASLHYDQNLFWRLVEEKLFSFFLPLIKNEDIIFKIKDWEEEQKEIYLNKNNLWESLPKNYLLTNRNYDFKKVENLLLPGILTEQMLYNMINQGEGFNIILQNGLKCFISQSLYNKWLVKGGTIQVLKQINIKGIAYNPYSPEGYSFSDGKMRQNIKELLARYNREAIPVFNSWTELEIPPI